MKILHTADWHLGKRLDGHVRLPEQRAVLKEICEIAEQNEVDAVIIAGDIYDHFNPPTEAVDLLYKTLHRLGASGRRLVFVLAGNHDSPERIEAPDSLARHSGIVMVGYPHTEVPLFALDTGLELMRTVPGACEFSLPGTEYPLRILHTSYANERRLKTYLGCEDEAALRQVLKQNWRKQSSLFEGVPGVNILAAHLLFTPEGKDVPEEPEEERPILHIGGTSAVYTEDIPVGIQYTALGHLHRKQSIAGHGGQVMYSGSPLSYSFAESNQTKYVLLVEVEPSAPAIVRPVALTSGRRLLRKRFEVVEEAVRWLRAHPDTWVELTVESEGYLSAEARKQLEEAHSGITAIIPEIQGETAPEESRQTIDLTLDRTALFIKYFKHRYGQEPNEELLDLFKEILDKNEAL